MSDTHDPNKTKPPSSVNLASDLAPVMAATSESISAGVSGSSAEPESAKLIRSEAADSYSSRLDKGPGLFESPQDALVQVEDLKYFLATAPASWQKNQVIRRYFLPTDEHISCVLWRNLYHITGTDIVRCLTFRFEAFGRRIKNRKKFEEGIFSDLRNLKTNSDAVLEGPKSPFLEFLYKNSCIRTQKKQKVFYWFSVSHDRLFVDALERDLKRESQKQEPTTEAIAEPALSFQYDDSKPLFEQLTDSIDANIENEDVSGAIKDEVEINVDVDVDDDSEADADADSDADVDVDDSIKNNEDADFDDNNISVSTEAHITRLEGRHIHELRKASDDSKIHNQSKSPQTRDSAVLLNAKPKTALTSTDTELRTTSTEIDVSGSKSKADFLKLMPSSSATMTSSMPTPTATELTGQVLNQHVEPSYNHITDQPMINTSTITLYSQPDFFNPASAKYGEFQQNIEVAPVIKSNIDSDFPLDYFPPSAFDALFSNYDMLDPNSAANLSGIGVGQAENGEYGTEFPHSATSGIHPMGMTTGVFNNSEQGFHVPSSNIIGANAFVPAVTTPYRSMFTSNAPYNYYGTELQQAPMIGSSLPADFTLPAAPVGYSLTLQAQLQQQQQQLQQLQQYQLQQQQQHLQQQLQALQGLDDNTTNINSNTLSLNSGGYNVPLYYNNPMSNNLANIVPVSGGNGNSFIIPPNFSFGQVSTPTSLFNQSYNYTIPTSSAMNASQQQQQSQFQPYQSPYATTFASANQANSGFRNLGSVMIPTPAPTLARPSLEETGFKSASMTNKTASTPVVSTTTKSAEVSTEGATTTTRNGGKRRQSTTSNSPDIRRKKSRSDTASAGDTVSGDRKLSISSGSTASSRAGAGSGGGISGGNGSNRIRGGGESLPHSESRTADIARFSVDCPLFEDYNIRNDNTKDANFDSEIDNSEGDSYDGDNNNEQDESRNIDEQKTINENRNNNENNGVEAGSDKNVNLIAASDESLLTKQEPFFEISNLDNGDKNTGYDVDSNQNTSRNQSEIIIEEVLGLR